MAVDAGQSWGEGFAQLRAHELIDGSLAGLSERERARVAISGRLPARAVRSGPTDP
jgi:hypothetical protein